jgi:uncharacterized membrane protein YeaQ/YmgE (transglycosylase-associated protein family)
MLIGILGWVICGVVVGFIGSKIVNLHGDDPTLGIGLGGAGGLVGGWLYSLLSSSPVTALNLWSLLTAGMVALFAVVVWHFIRSRGTHARPSIRRSY